MNGSHCHITRWRESFHGFSGSCWVANSNMWSFMEISSISVHCMLAIMCFIAILIILFLAYTFNHTIQLVINHPFYSVMYSTFVSMFVPVHCYILLFFTFVRNCWFGNWFLCHIIILENVKLHAGIYLIMELSMQIL